MSLGGMKMSNDAFNLNNDQAELLLIWQTGERLPRARQGRVKSSR
jgi:hypothetical protein